MPSGERLKPAIILSFPPSVTKPPIDGAEITPAQTTRLWVILKTSPPTSSSEEVAKSVTEADTAFVASPVTLVQRSLMT